jgi:DNA-binding transcriptional regulator YhcF (GntR family)
MQDIPGLQFRRGGPLPLHSQIAEAFRKAIQEGRLKPGDRLPSEPELVTQLGVSRATIRQAMAELLAEGLIYRYQGRGTFVAPQKLEHPLQRLISFSEDIRSRGMQPGSKLLFFGQVNADAEIAAYLQIPPGKTVLRIYRLRLCVLGVGVLFARTTWGFELSLHGMNPVFVRWAGIRAPRVILTAMGLSGFLGGLAGAL